MQPNTFCRCTRLTNLLLTKVVLLRGPRVLRTDALTPCLFEALRTVCKTGPPKRSVHQVSPGNACAVRVSLQDVLVRTSSGGAVVNDVNVHGTLFGLHMFNPPCVAYALYLNLSTALAAVLVCATRSSTTLVCCRVRDVFLSS